MSMIFVAGLTGPVRDAVIDALAKQGAAVAAGPDGTNAPAGVAVRAFDFDDQASMAAAMAGCDRLFLAPPFCETMARAGSRAVAAAREAGVSYIVLASRYDASSDAHWRMGREFGMVEQFVEDSGIPFTVLRANTPMQKFTGLLADAVRSGRVPLPEESHPVSYLDARDVAACAVRLLLDSEGHENRFYALTGPEGLTGADAAARLSDALGRAVAYEAIEEEPFIEGLDAAGYTEWQRNMEVSLSRVVKLGMMGNVTGAVEYLTGAPARTFAEFAAEHAATWK
ncbi:NmrA family NAD(P)-binding protein [Pseudodesulfovibrio sp.]|uniref:NmrA family NAD(P)-binding protein n=1 Tax=Pseudodesulfovibrio sp. TaxID=2035812 RepID=UPI0026021E0D|nr:NmrA family NAD(P)-binding protein [Pseudodesulfovibrio sp.]MDD3312068.1 NmrA family NAD(P)-binding protein [Pseudodesulfovibrio sp.]